MGGISSSGRSKSDDIKPGNDINFLLYCTPRKNTFTELTEDNIASIPLSRYDPKKKTKVLIHGYMSHGFDEFPGNVKDAYLDRNKNDYNIICVDWGKRSGIGLDSEMLQNLQIVAKNVTYLLIRLVVTTELSPGNVHLVGHCLGAHVCGMVGNSMRDIGMTLGRISALNPAGCGLDPTGKIRMLEKTDADFVDVYRTSCKSENPWPRRDQNLYYRAILEGKNTWPGHVYFSIKGSWTQATCTGYQGTCNHAAHRIFARTILEGTENPDDDDNAFSLQVAGHESATSSTNRRVVVGEYCLPGTEGHYHIEFHGGEKKQFALLMKELPGDSFCRFFPRSDPQAVATAPSSKINADYLEPVKFLLYCNPNNKHEGTELILKDLESLKESNFNANKKTKVLIHGMTAHVFSEFPRNVKDAYLKNQHKNDHNVICVNWGQSSGITALCYSEVVNRLDPVAERLSDLLIWLAETSELDLYDVHLVGFSLGAEICGYVGRKVTEKAEGKALGRISALDPPGWIGFGLDNGRISLEKTDAKFVDVYRTSSLSPARKPSQGHIDFIINGGRQQPNCEADFLGACSHSEAPRFYAQTILDGPDRTNLTSKVSQSQGRQESIYFSTDRSIIVGEYCKEPKPEVRVQYSHHTKDYINGKPSQTSTKKHAS